MITSFIDKLIEGFNFSIKDFVVLIVITIFLIGGNSMYALTIDTNEKVNSMEKRYFHDVYDNGFAVLASLQNNNILEPRDIVSFLESKPAGKSDLKKAVEIDEIYERLVNVFDVLAKNSKTALTY